MRRPALWLAFALLAAPPALAQLGGVTFQITNTAGSFSYTWTLDKTIQGTETQSNVRVQKGVVSDINYVLKYTRAVDTTTQQFTVSGTFTATNGANAATLNSATGQVTGGTGAATDFTPSCSPAVGSQVPPSTTVTCTFTSIAYNGYPAAGTVTGTMAFTDTVTSVTGTVVGTSSTFVYDNVVGQYATATLADKFDLTPLDRLYTGFTGFQRSTVWKYADPATAVPESGVTVTDSDQKAYTIKAGSFAVCTDVNGLAITNTATLTPTGGTAITKTATANIVIFGCDIPPTVNFQELQTWGAQTFSWALTSRAVRNAITVDQSAGSVGVDYTLQATATPTTGSWAVSGSVFISNTQPGILNIARLQVQLSGGQQAIPQCQLTSPYVSADGLVWGGTNAGGSTTTVGLGAGLGVGVVGASAINGIGGVGVVGTVGTFTQFILPEFASATCRFNITISQQPSPTMTITPMVNWGFSGQYMLNQQTQQNLNWNPPQQFFPVQNCIQLTDVVQAGVLSSAVANGGPNQQQVCVNGQTQPFEQPAPLSYTMTVTVNPTTTADCTAGSQKTYPITNSVTGNVVGGSPVTAKADPVQLTVNCAKAATTTVVPQSAGDVANLNVVVGQFQTFAGGDYSWTVDKSVDDDTVSLKVGDPPKTATYTVKVTKGAATSSKFFVFGKITVTNPGTKPVDVSTVSITAGSAAVPATCPAGSKTVAPGVPLVCTFNVTWNNGANSGSLGARVDTPETSFYGQPASFDFTNAIQGGAKGATADVYDDATGEAPKAATGVPTKWFVLDGSSPPAKADGMPLTTVDSRDYVYTMQLGPFADKGSCGTYKVTNVATLQPDGGTPLTATKVLTLSVTGCKETEYQSDNSGPVGVTVDSVTTVNLTGNTWQVTSKAKQANLTLAEPKTGTATFEVSFEKVPKFQAEVSGTVTVTNSDPQNAMSVDSVTVAVEGTVAKTVDAVCGSGSGSLQLAGGGTQQCTFTAVLSAGGNGEVIATVTTTDGKATPSTPTAFDFAKATTKPSSTAPACAQATTGIIVGLPTFKPGGAAGFTPKEEKICESKKVSVDATVGPFEDNQCGTFDVLHVARLQPLSANAAALSDSAALAVTVTGCPASEGKAPLIVAKDPVVEVQEAYKWTATMTSNASGAVTFKQKAAAKVMFTATTERSAVQRSASLSGSVTLEAPAAAPVKVTSANVAVYDGSGKYVTALLDCGAGTTPGGPLTLKGKGSPLTCAYNASVVGTGDGAVLPVIVVDGANAPSPASPAAYAASSAPRNIVGDCADLGNSLLLVGASDSKRAAWQPAFVGQPLGSGSDCDGGDMQRFSLWFGANAQGEPQSVACGDYKFKGTLTLAPTNGDPVVSDVAFPVKVSCRRRRSLMELLEPLVGRPGGSLRAA